VDDLKSIAKEEMLDEDRSKRVDIIIHFNNKIVEDKVSIKTLKKRVKEAKERIERVLEGQALELHYHSERFPNGMSVGDRAELEKLDG